MTTIYKSLATHLDKLPGGYPPTPSGVELRILERLFTRQEASIAVYLTLRPEPPGKIAQRVGQAEETLAPVLYEMSKKGLIVRKEKDGKRFY
ncbi:MAG: 4Fe-4S ferredoxin, partial [Desulfatitalea sp.]|nr:4Fe-4S ferredoxin [Desulfatitalea sp.]NNK00050.1 4Fe-4S ferredoxin [Desulfatitalea sp.]